MDRVTKIFQSDDFGLSNKPAITFVGKNYEDNLLFANYSARIYVGDAFNGVHGTLQVNITFNGDFDYGSVCFLDKIGGKLSVTNEGRERLYGISSEDDPLECIFRTDLDDTSSKTYYLVINTNSRPTSYVDLYFALGNYDEKPIGNVTLIVDYTCEPEPIYRYTAGLHVYSAYDAVESRARLTTELFSFTPKENWVLGTAPIFANIDMTILAFTYYYGIGDKVYRIGEEIDRSEGYLIEIVASGSVFSLIFNPPTITANKIYGNYQSDIIRYVSPDVGERKVGETTVSCVIPTIIGRGIIRDIIEASEILQPPVYKYYFGASSSSARDANDAAFTDFNFSTKTNDPITGAMHAVKTYGIGSISGNDEFIVLDTIKLYDFFPENAILRTFGTSLAISTGILILVYILGYLGYELFDDNWILNILREIAEWFDKPGGPFQPWGIIIKRFINWIALLPPASRKLTMGLKLIPLILWGFYVLWLTFRTNTIPYREDCNNFLIGYTNTPYINNGNLINSLSIGNNPINFWFGTDILYLCDGVYFYETLNSVVTNKTLSGTVAMIQSIPPLAPIYEYRDSVLADNPEHVTDILKLVVLPYTSGKDVTCQEGIEYFNREITTIVTNLSCCNLQYCDPITVTIPAGRYVSCKNQEDADRIAKKYFDIAVEAAISKILIANCFSGNDLGTLLTDFTHEIKIETNPTQTTVYYDNRLPLSPMSTTTGTTLYYDPCGCIKVLDGYYAVSGVTPYRTFYYTKNGVINDIYIMLTPEETMVQKLGYEQYESIITSNLDYSSNWYLTYADSATLYERYVYPIIGNQKYDTTQIYSVEQLRKGFLKEPRDIIDFQLYLDFTTTDYEEADMGWYYPLIPWGLGPNFYYNKDKTIVLDIEQDCQYTDGETITRGCYIIGKENGVERAIGNEINVTIDVYNPEELTATYTALTNASISRTFVLFDEQIEPDEEISNIEITAFNSENPINKTTYEFGSYLGCGCYLKLSFESTDTTATVTVENGVSGYTYVWSNGQTTINSMLNTNTATSLISGTTYSVTVTDGNGCSKTGEIVVGEQKLTFDADYIVLTYDFSSGSDLEMRTRIAVPDVGQITQLDYIGLELQSFWPITGNTILEFGGNSGGLYKESILINISTFREFYPTETQIVIDCRAYWLENADLTPVNVVATLYKGGVMVAEGETGSPPFSFTNSLYSKKLEEIILGSKEINLVSVDPQTSGQRIGTLTYYLTNFDLIFNVNDITTPEV